MTDSPSHHYRKLLRRRGYDYALPGGYFVTIVTHKREPIFGRIVDAEIQLNTAGEVAFACWREIPKHFDNVSLDDFVVMPNHIHGIIMIQESETFHEKHGATRNAGPGGHAGAPHAAPLRGGVDPQLSSRKQATLGTLINSYKSAVTKILHRQQNDPIQTIWQRSYHDRIVRNEREMNAIRAYILANPSNWERDPENKSVG